MTDRQTDRNRVRDLIVKATDPYTRGEMGGGGGGVMQLHCYVGKNTNRKQHVGVHKESNTAFTRVVLL